MIPPLPIELLAHTFALANEDLPPVERQLNRQRFGRVCRGWFRAVDKWSEVVVIGVEALRDLRDELRADVHFEGSGQMVGPRVRSLHLWLKSGVGSNAWQTALGAVFEHVPNLTKLGISADLELNKNFGVVLPDQFSLVPHLTEFSLSGLGISAEALAKCASFTPALTTMSLYECTVNPATSADVRRRQNTTPIPSVFAANHRLSKLRLGAAINYATLDIMLSDLPPSLVDLSLVLNYRWGTPEQRGSPVLPQRLEPIAHQLFALHIEDLSGMFPLDPSFWTLPVSLRRLVVGTKTLAAFPQSLSAFDKLQQITCVEGRRHSGMAQKLLQFLEQVSSLAEVRLSKSVYKALDRQARSTIKVTAARHAVQLVIT